MKKSNGFVFMETIVVISVLSITLLLLFSSYSYILRKSRSKNTFDTTENIYKTYYFHQVLNSSVGLNNYLKTSSCQLVKTINGSGNYICQVPSTNANLNQIKNVFEIEKFYYVNPSNLINASDSNALLNKFDATTIDYILNLGVGVNYNVLIVKYKKVYSDGSYEIYHSSMEVS